jgi:DNA-dependent RNA polymerase auxiliary subunit epsilon
MDRLELNLERMQRDWEAWREEHQKDVLRLDNALSVELEGQAEIRQLLAAQDKHTEYMERVMDRLSSIAVDHTVRIERLEKGKQPGESAA